MPDMLQSRQAAYGHFEAPGRFAPKPVVQTLHLTAPKRTRRHLSGAFVGRALADASASHPGDIDALFGRLVCSTREMSIVCIAVITDWSLGRP